MLGKVVNLMPEIIEKRFVIKVRELNDGAIWISGVGQTANGVQQDAGQLVDAHDIAVNVENICAVQDMAWFYGAQVVHIAMVDGDSWLLYGTYGDVVSVIDVKGNGGN